MKLFIAILLLFVQQLSAEEKADYQKLLDKHIGKWEMVISGNLMFNNQEPQNLHFKGMMDAAPIYNKNFIVQKYLSSGKDFEGKKTDSENLEFLFFDREKQKLVAIQFNTGTASYSQYFKVESDRRYSGVLKNVPQVKMSHGIEFLNDDKERVGFYATQNDLINMTLNMNWHGHKVEKFKGKFQAAKIESKNKSIEQFKTKTNKWILKGEYLYEEVKGEKVYTEVIGQMINKKEIRKYQFHSDGQVQAFKSIKKEGKEVWEKVDYEYKIPGM